MSAVVYLLLIISVAGKAIDKVLFLSLKVTECFFLVSIFAMLSAIAVTLNLTWILRPSRNNNCFVT